jgi:hypothetical protein
MVKELRLSKDFLIQGLNNSESPFKELLNAVCNVEYQESIAKTLFQEVVQRYPRHCFIHHHTL